MDLKASLHGDVCYCDSRDIHYNSCNHHELSSYDNYLTIVIATITVLTCTILSLYHSYHDGNSHTRLIILKITLTYYRLLF